MKPIDLFYLEKEEPVKGCLLALKDVILNYHSELTPRWYYKLPCFMYGDHIFCYLWIDKKSGNPYIAVGQGLKIDHPDLIQGKRTFTKVLPIDPSKDLPQAKIYNIFDQVMHVLHSL